MKNKTLKRTFVTLALALALLPALNRPLPLPDPAPGTVAENTTKKPGIQPLDDYESEDKIKE